MSEHDELHRIETIEARQQALRHQLRSEGPALTEDDPIFAFAPVDPRVYERSCESLVGQVAIPVGVVGPLHLQYREYREDDHGELAETGPARSRSFFIPMATHEGGLNASLNRGIKAANECGGVATYVLHASMTRGSCYVFETTEQAYLFSKWIPTQLGAMKAWLQDPDNPFREAVLNGIPLLSRYARLQHVDTYLVSNTCHVVFRYSTGDACGQNMTTRNTYMLHSHFILPKFHEATHIAPAQFFLEANTGGDKKSSHLYHIHGGHGRTVVAAVMLSEEVLRRTLKCSVDDLLKLREVGSEGAALAGMIGMSVNPVNVIAAIFAATGQDLACAGTSSMAMMSVAECPGGVQFTLRLPNLEVGTVGGGAGLPHQGRYLDILQCRGDDSANKFAQIVTGAALCLELSTGCAMAAAGSLSFYTAHLERGGMKRTPVAAQVSPELMRRLKEDAPR
jgi:hydroxymethylglutaryl-CoA reductase (NADPH)